MTGAAARRLRRTARILLIDPGGRILLFRYTAQGVDPFWIMPGGECDEGEAFEAAAQRELFEETGILAEPCHTGSVKHAEYVYDGEPVRSVEHFFWHRAASAEIDTSRHTELEREVMRDFRWFTTSELGGWPETIYPQDLDAMVANIASQVAR